MVRYLTEIDHHDHEAMVALDERCNEESESPATCAIARGPTRRSLRSR